MKIYGVLLVPLFFPLVAASDDTWSSFQNGGNLNPKIVGVDFSAEGCFERNQQWSTRLMGYGQSSPVYDGKILYVTSVKGKSKETCIIQAKRIEDGTDIWHYQLKNSSPETNSNYVSRAAPTPVCDQRGVIAFFEGGNLVALTRDGKVRWELDLVKKFGPIQARHGLASSLEQDGVNVYVWVERQQSPYLLAINKETGEIGWKTDGLGVTSWSSPRRVAVGKSHHLVLSGIGKIAGYDPKSGKQLWLFDKISGNSTPSPVPIGNGRFLIGASSGRGESTAGKAAQSNGLVQISSKEGKYQAEFVWQAKQATSSFGSPLAHGGQAYFVNRSGVLFCLDLKTGEEVYTARIKSSVWATPLGIGNQVLLFGKDGTTTVVDAGQSFKKLAVHTIWKKDQATESEGSAAPSFGGPVLYSGILAGKSLIFRRGDQMACVRCQ